MSPIKGISEVVRLPRLGKIRLGIKKEGLGKSYPEPTDYFVCPEEVKKVFGEKPQELRIMFPSNNPEQWASQYLRRYSQSRRLICRGNGETAIAFSKFGDLKEVQCNPAKCNSYQEGQCRRVMNLQFLLPDCPGYGVYQLDTSSYHSMVNINSSLILARSLFSRLSMIPLSLMLIKREVQPKGQIKTVQVLVLLPTLSIEKTRKFAQFPTAQSLVLPPPDNEAPDDLFPDQGLVKEPGIKGSRDDVLVELWDRAKRKIWHFEIQNYQIARYFAKHNLEVGLKDFELPLPPEKIKAEYLKGFLAEVNHYFNST
jgi:hypothetical protein